MKQAELCRVAGAPSCSQNHSHCFRSSFWYRVVFTFRHASAGWHPKPGLPKTAMLVWTPAFAGGDGHISGRGVSGFASGARTACGMQGPGVEPCIPNWLLQLKCCNAALILLPPIAGTCASCRSQVFVTIGCFDVCDRLVRYHGCHFRNHGGLSVEGGICHPDHRNDRQADDQRQWQNLVMCKKRHVKSPPWLSVCFRCLVS